MKLATKIKCLKYLVFAYIVLLVITGAIEIIVGGGLVWLHLRYTPILDSQFYKPALVVLLIGPVVFVLSWFGWSATAKKNRVHLGLFTVGLVIIVVIQFFIVGWTISMRESLPNAADFTVNSAFTNFIRDQSSDSKGLWNRVQAEVQCCGVYGVHDYRRIDKDIPQTCCSAGDDPADAYCKHIYQRGCLHGLSSNTKTYLLICGLTALASAIIESFGIFCIIQLTILLNRRTTFDIEGRSEVASSGGVIPSSQSSRTLVKGGELMPLADAAAAKAKQKTAPQPPLPVPIPKAPSPSTEKLYKVSTIRKESNGTSN